MLLLIASFLLGVFLLHAQSSLPSVALIAFGFLCALLFFGLGRRCRAKKGVSLFAYMLSSVLLGFGWTAFLSTEKLSETLPDALEMQELVVTGVVASLPQRFGRSERFIFEVEAYEGFRSERLPKKILLSWQHRADELDDAAIRTETASVFVKPAERLCLTVRLKKPHGNANLHGFDYELWLLERGIGATGSVRPKAPFQRLDAFVFHPLYAIERLRYELRERFFTFAQNAPHVGILLALAIGDQRAIPASEWAILTRTGTSHLVSISGLHVSLVAFLVGFLTKLFWRRIPKLMLCLPAQKAALYTGVIVAFFYALLSGFAIPAQRSLIMLVVLAACLLLSKNWKGARILGFALFVVLLFDPWAVLSPGFWLSFGAVATLFYLTALKRFTQNRWRDRLLEAANMQWGVTLGTLPLLILFFQQASWVSPLANALAIPLVSFVIAPLVLLFVLIPWAPLLGAAHALLAVLMSFLTFLAEKGAVYFASPPFWAILLSMMGFLLLLLPRGFPAKNMGFFLLLPALSFSPERPKAGEVWIDVLDVGQGLSVFLRTQNENLLYDTGPAYGNASDAGERIVFPYLRAEGIKALSMLILSHKDKDHSGGAAFLTKELPIQRTLASFLPEAQACVSGKAWRWDGVDFEVLYPFAHEALPQKSNRQSCVLQVGVGKNRLLLTADIEKKDELRLVEKWGDRLKSNVLQVPHHGGSSSSSEVFIQAVLPSALIFSVGYQNHFGHPKPEVLARYQKENPKAVHLRTDQDGQLRLVLSDKHMDVRKIRGENRHYWQSGIF